MEVVVSAAVLAIVAVRGARRRRRRGSSSTGREKSRSIAANLAEQDQERMRSMQVDSLADFDRDPHDRRGRQADYSVKSAGRVDPRRHGRHAELPEQLQAGRLPPDLLAGDLRRPSARARKPVVIESLVAPSVAYSSTRGSLAVQVNNRDGVGVPGIAVNVTRALRRTQPRANRQRRLRDLPVPAGGQLRHPAQPPGLGRPLRHHRRAGATRTSPPAT